MAIAFDTASANSSLGTTTSTSVTITGSNTITLAAIGANSGSTVNSITLGGSAMTFIASGEETGIKTFLYYYLGASGSPTISADVSSGPICLQVGVYSGVNQVAPEASNFGSTINDTFDLSVTTISDNAWVVEGAATNQSGANLNAGTGTTKRIGTSANRSGGIYDANAAISPPASTTLQVTQTSARKAGVIVSIAPAAAAAGGVRDGRYLSLLGIGT